MALRTLSPHTVSAQGCSLASFSAGKNGVGDAGAIAVGAALRTNVRLKRLGLYRNEIADDGAFALAEALGDSRTLEVRW